MLVRFEPPKEESFTETNQIPVPELEQLDQQNDPEDAFEEVVEEVSLQEMQIVDIPPPFEKEEQPVEQERIQPAPEKPQDEVIQPQPAQTAAQQTKEEIRSEVTDKTGESEGDLPQLSAGADTPGADTPGADTPGADTPGADVLRENASRNTSDQADSSRSPLEPESSTRLTETPAKSQTRLEESRSEESRSEVSVVEKLKNMDYLPQISEQRKIEDSYEVEGKKIMPSSQVSSDMEPVVTGKADVLRPSQEMMGGNASMQTVEEKIALAVNNRTHAQRADDESSQEEKESEGTDEPRVLAPANVEASDSVQSHREEDVNQDAKEDQQTALGNPSADQNPIPFERLDAVLKDTDTSSILGDKETRNESGSQTSEPHSESSTSDIDIEWEDARVGGSRILLSRINPRLPGWVSQEGLRLKVVVSFVLTPEGILTAVKEEESDYSEVAAAVVEAIRKWKFKPSLGARNIKGKITYLILPKPIIPS